MITDEGATSSPGGVEYDTLWQNDHISVTILADIRAYAYAN
jgi:hypothetical protein